MAKHTREGWLRRMYEDEGLSINGIADEAGVDYRVIYDQMLKHGIDRRESFGPSSDDSDGKHRDEEWLRARYHGEGLSLKAVAERAGVHFTTISRWMDRLGIDKRDPHCEIADIAPEGEANGNWEGGKTSENRTIRNSPEYEEWRQSVFERDDYTCQECGERGGTLNAHHIEPLSQNRSTALDMDNGVTLCEDCHDKKHEKIPIAGGD